MYSSSDGGSINDEDVNEVADEERSVGYSSGMSVYQMKNNISNLRPTPANGIWEINSSAESFVMQQ